MSLDQSIGFHEELLFQQLALGTELGGRWNSVATINYAFDRLRIGDSVLPQHQLVWNVRFSPSTFLSQIAITGAVGWRVDLDNARGGKGADVGLSVTLRPTPQLELVLAESLRVLYVSEQTGIASDSPWVFTAHVGRARTTFSFTPELSLRAVIQYAETLRNADLYLSEVSVKEATLGASLLLAYRINWQSSLFAGYTDSRPYSDVTGALETAERRVFLKASYAFQR